MVEVVCVGEEKMKKEKEERERARTENRDSRVTGSLLPPHNSQPLNYNLQLAPKP